MINETFQVTVVMAVYNAEKTLPRAIDSVINQTYCNWLLICVNDGSTDNSLDVLYQYAEKDTRIRVLTQENEGPAAARAKAYEVVETPYVIMLDADDFYSLDLLECLVTKANQSGADAIVPNVKIEQIDGRFMDWNQSYHFTLGMEMDGREAFSRTFIEPSMHGINLWKTDLVKRFSNKENTEYNKMNADEFIQRLLFLNSKKIVFSESAKLTLEYLKEIADAKQPWYMQDKLCEHFALGKIGILPFASSWNQCLYSYLKAKEPVFVSDMPSFKKGNAYRHFYSGFSLGIFRAGVLSEKQLYAAWNWLKFLFCVFPQELCSQSMTLPMRNDASPYISNIYPDIYHLSKHSLKHSQPQPDFVGMRNVYSLIGNAIRQFQLRKTGINETLERMQNSVCQSIGKTGRDYFTQNS